MKQFRQGVIRRFKQVGSLPRALVTILRERRLKAGRAEREAERLDRIRNPSKYLGK